VRGNFSPPVVVYLTDARVPRARGGACAREARTLGDPIVRSALVAPITAAQARVVFAHRRRGYPGHTDLLVLRGEFVTPRNPCPTAAAGCGLGADRL
jgi:hypothetical protein